MVAAKKVMFSNHAADDDIERFVERASLHMRAMHIPGMFMSAIVGRIRGEIRDVVGAGMRYPNSYYLGVIAIGLPQDAMNQWRDDPLHWDAVINSRVTEIGVGYVYNKFSSFGGYWTVNMGGP